MPAPAGAATVRLGGPHNTSTPTHSRPAHPATTSTACSLLTGRPCCQPRIGRQQQADPPSRAACHAPLSCMPNERMSQTRLLLNCQCAAAMGACRGSKVWWMGCDKSCVRRYSLLATSNRSKRAPAVLLAGADGPPRQPQQAGHAQEQEGDWGGRLPPCGAQSSSGYISCNAWVWGGKNGNKYARPLWPALRAWRQGGRRAKKKSSERGPGGQAGVSLPGQWSTRTAGSPSLKDARQTTLLRRPGPRPAAPAPGTIACQHADVAPLGAPQGAGGTGRAYHFSTRACAASVRVVNSL